MQSLCDRWEFVSDWYDGFAVGEGEGERVRLPHTVKEIPQHYADSQSYQMVCGYRKKLTLEPALAGKRLFVQFDGAAHIATVFLNGQELATHRCGYTAFRVDITDAAVPGGAGHHRERRGAALRICHRLSDLRRALPGGLAGRPGKELY